MFTEQEGAFLSSWVSCRPRDATSDQELTAATPAQAAWSPAEHQRFLDAMTQFPAGPWKAIAAYIGTRTARQARTHAQKHKEKLHRRQRKLERMQSYVAPQLTTTTPSTTAATRAPRCQRHGVPWTPAEEERLAEAFQMFPEGPWRSIAVHVRTRTIRQVMTHCYRNRVVCFDHSAREGNAEIEHDCASTTAESDDMSEPDRVDGVSVGSLEELIVDEASESRSFTDEILQLLDVNDLVLLTQPCTV